LIPYLVQQDFLFVYLTGKCTGIWFGFEDI